MNYWIVLKIANSRRRLGAELLKSRVYYHVNEVKEKLCNKELAD